jgi:hypothetical protein
MGFNSAFKGLTAPNDVRYSKEERDNIQGMIIRDGKFRS